jgi:hypothetical protein
MLQRGAKRKKVNYIGIAKYYQVYYTYKRGLAIETWADHVLSE